MNLEADADDAPYVELVCLRAAGFGGPSVRKQLRRQLSAREYRGFLKGFAADLAGRFERLDARILTADALRVASMSDMLGFHDLSRAARSLVIACNVGAGVLDALANVSLAQASVLVTIAIETDAPRWPDELAA